MGNLEQILKGQAQLTALQQYHKEGVRSYFEEIQNSIPDNDDLDEVNRTVSSKVNDALKIVDNIDDDYSFVNEIACEYMLDVMKRTIVEYEGIIKCAKDIAMEYGLPEEDVVAKQRKQFLTNLATRDSKLDELYGLGVTGKHTINEMVSNSTKHPEITSVLINQFFEGYFTSGLETDRFKENCDRFLAFTDALSIQGKLTEIGENISHGFKDSLNLSKFIISHSNSIKKNDFMKYHLPDLIEFFLDEPEFFNKLLKDTLSNSSLFKHKPEDTSKNDMVEFQTSKFSNIIKFCAENNLEVDDQNLASISKNMGNFFLVNQRKEMYDNIEKLKIIKHNNALNEKFNEVASQNTQEADPKLESMTNSFKL